MIQTNTLAIGIMGTALLFSSLTEGYAAAGTSNQPLVYVGTFTGPGKGKGIYAYRMDPATGSMTSLGLAAETASPTFLDIDSRGQRLYAVNEINRFGDKDAGAVSGFSIDRETGKLSFLNQRSSGGPGPCHITLDRAGQNALVANYNGGSVAVLPIGLDGRLGEAKTFIQHAGKSVHPDRQTGPHAHCVMFDPAERFAFVCDLGLDKVLIYHFDSANSTLVPNGPPYAQTGPGSGPRHITFHPNGRFAYVIHELDSTITVFKYDPTRGALEAVQTVSCVPADFKGNKWAAEIQVHPSGKYLYASNRSHDTIAVFAIDPATGKLDCVQHEPTQGKTPRHFTLDPTGKFLLAANQDSDTIVIFSIDAATGRIKPTGNVVHIPGPACVRFVPGGSTEP